MIDPYAQIKALLFRRIGDSLLATPALRAIKKALPGNQLSVVVEPQVIRVFENNPWIDNITSVASGPSFFELALLLRKNSKPDIVLDFLSDPRSAFACLLSGAKQRIGFNYRFRQFVYTDGVAKQNPESPVYSANHKLQFAERLGCSGDGISTDFFLTASDIDFAEQVWCNRGWNSSVNIVAFFISSRRAYKRWSLDNFAELIHRMTADNVAQPLILSTPGDEPLVSELIQRCNLSPDHMIMLSDLGHLGAVLKKCRLLVGNDGGPKHIAVALNVPTITIFLADRPEYWTPPDSSRHIVLSAVQNDSSIAAPDQVFQVLFNHLRLLES